MKFGLMGPGIIAKKFANACKQVEGVELIAVASSVRERALSFAEEFGIAKAYSYEEMLDAPDIDAVYIAVINTRHYELVKKCLEKGKAVLCEKPFCMTLKEAEELVNLARERDILLMEATWSLCLPCIKCVKEWISEGRIGTVKFIQSAMSFFAPFNMESRLFNPEMGGGALYDVGIYTLSFILTMAGKNPERLEAEEYIGESGVEEVGSALLRCPGGTVGQATYAVQASAGDEANVYGSEGRISLPHFWRCREALLMDAKGNVIEKVTDDKENGFVYEIEAFARAYANGDNEVKEVPHSLTLTCARIFEEIKA